MRFGATRSTRSFRKNDPDNEADMKNSRIALAAIAAATFLIAAAPAQARHAKHHKADKGSVSAARFDAGSVPAYPTGNEGNRFGYSEATRALKGSRMARGGRRGAKATHEAFSGETGSGIVRSKKTGATAHVSARFAPIAQAVVDDLERGGATIRFMGGYRKGPCWAGGLHPCGLAIDLCQTARGVVDARCNLPSRAVEASVAAAHGALSGGIWCNQDRGHIQLGQTAGACGSNLYAAVSKFKGQRTAARRHHRVRYAGLPQR